MSERKEKFTEGLYGWIELIANNRWNRKYLESHGFYWDEWCLRRHDGVVNVPQENGGPEGWSEEGAMRWIGKKLLSEARGEE